VRVIGRREGLSRDLVQMIDDAEARTRQTTLLPEHRLQLRRPGRHRDAARRFAEDVRGRPRPPETSTRQLFARYLRRPACRRRI
jgi:undecaprenyl pyrophosphate synthase